MSQGPAVIVESSVLDGAPIRAVSYLEPEHEWDSGFAVWSSEPKAASDQHSALVCLHCFVDQHPEAGRGMDLARHHGEAVRRNSGWIVK